MCFQPLLSCMDCLHPICQGLGNKHQWVKKQSPLDYGAECVDKIRAQCHQVRVKHWFQHQVVKLKILCNLKFHVITSHVVLCPRKFDFLHNLSYNFQISLFVLFVRESVCLDFCDHKKGSGSMLWWFVSGHNWRYSFAWAKGGGPRSYILYWIFDSTWNPHTFKWWLYP